MIYFCHGVPGCPADLSLVQVPENQQAIAADFLTDGGLAGAVARFDAATADTSGKIQLVGFSIGAMIAIHIAANRPDRIDTLTLISPAAPLTLGSFLDDMAGKPVFTLAAKSPRMLTALTALQGVILRIAPNLLIKPLFAKCGDDERALIGNPDFRNTLIAGLKTAYQNNRSTYVKTIRDYVSDWSDQLDKITCPTTIWHGDADTWAPVAMAYALENQINAPVTLKIVEGGEHFTTLKKATLT